MTRPDVKIRAAPRAGPRSGGRAHPSRGLTRRSRDTGPVRWACGREGSDRDRAGADALVTRTAGFPSCGDERHARDQDRRARSSAHHLLLRWFP